MPFRDILDPEQLAVFTDVLEDVCLAAGMPRNSSKREDVAALVMYFYGHGYHSVEELKAALNEAVQQERDG